jgi:uncharacterized sodium:solute symporter family permease YidK
MFIFVVPPIAARLLYPEAVMGMDISKPAEAAYAVACLNLLPAGLLGLMVTAMFAASMANIDTGLNANAAVYIQNVHPFFLRLFKRPIPGDEALLSLSRKVSVVFGLLIIGLALYFASQRQLGMFEAMLHVMGMFGLPLVIPVLMAVFIRWAPSWTPFVVITAAVIPSLIKVAAVQGWVPIEPWNYQTNIAIVLSTGIIAFLICVPFHFLESQEYQERVREFYRRMHTPVDFEKEVGEANDAQQGRIIGGFVMAAAAFVLLLLVIPNTIEARVGIAFVAAFIFLVGVFLRFAGRVKIGEK